MKTIWRDHGLWPAMAIACLLGSCGPDDTRVKLAAGERELIELNHRIALLQYRLEMHLSTRGLETIGDLDHRLENLQNLRRGLESDWYVLRKETKVIGDRFEEFRSNMIITRRSAATGLVLERLMIRDGRIYEDVMITGVEDIGVRIRHRTGTATLRYNLLTDEQRVRFGMDAELALLAEQSLDSKESAWQAWIARESMMKRRGAEASATVTPTIREFPAVVGRTSTRGNPLAEPSRPFGASSRYRSFRPRYRPVYYHYRFYQPCSWSNTRVPNWISWTF